MKGIAVVLKSPLAEVFGLSGVSYFKSYDSNEEFRIIIEKISAMKNIGLVIVSHDLQDETSKKLDDKVVIGV